MEIPFSEYPGRHERHFRRKLKNSLFPRPLDDYTNDDLLEVQRLDHEEIVAFLAKLRKLVEQAVALKQSEESDVVLDLKAELEKTYETACRLGDQQGNNKSAIRDLLKVIMATVRAHAGEDAKAESELQQEEMARQHHFSLLEYKLVADLIDADSLILEDELAAVMLTEEEGQVKKALELLDENQRRLLAAEALELLSPVTLTSDQGLMQRVEMIHSVEE